MVMRGVGMGVAVRRWLLVVLAVVAFPAQASVLYVHNGASSRIDRYDASSGAFFDAFIVGNFRTSGAQTPGQPELHTLILLRKKWIWAR